MGFGVMDSRTFGVVGGGGFAGGHYCGCEGRVVSKAGGWVGVQLGDDRIWMRVVSERDINKEYIKEGIMHGPLRGNEFIKEFYVWLKETGGRS